MGCKNKNEHTLDTYEDFRGMIAETSEATNAGISLAGFMHLQMSNDHDPYIARNPVKTMAPACVQRMSSSAQRQPAPLQ